MAVTREPVEIRDRILTRLALLSREAFPTDEEVLDSDGLDQAEAQGIDRAYEVVADEFRKAGVK